MMSVITSYNHLTHLLQTDVRYKWVLILAYYSNVIAYYKHLRDITPVEGISLKTAINWVDKWIETNVRVGSTSSWHYDSCLDLMNCINYYIKVVDDNPEKYKNEPLP